MGGEWRATGQGHIERGNCSQYILCEKKNAIFNKRKTWSSDAIVDKDKSTLFTQISLFSYFEITDDSSLPSLPKLSTNVLL